MGSPKLQAFREELQAELEDISKPAEGMSDFSRVAQGNEEREMKQQGEGAARDLVRRRTLIGETLTVLERLEGDGYPGITVRTIDAATYKQMQDQLATMQAALAKFAPAGTVTDLAFAPGEPAPKTPEP